MTTTQVSHGKCSVTRPFGSIACDDNLAEIRINDAQYLCRKVGTAFELTKMAVKDNEEPKVYTVRLRGCDCEDAIYRHKATACKHYRSLVALCEAGKL